MRSRLILPSIGSLRRPLKLQLAGFGMFEFTLALALFSAGMLGLLSAQLAGQRSIQAALDRSLATSLTADFLARVEANSGRAADYSAQSLGATNDPPVTPPVDCYRLPCSSFDLVAFDVWDWQQQLISSRNTLLPQPRACITYSHSVATVSLSWRGKSELAAVDDPPCEGGEPADSRWRRQVTLSTFIGGAG